MWSSTRERLKQSWPAHPTLSAFAEPRGHHPPRCAVLMEQNSGPTLAPLCMYRIARGAGQSRERRTQASHPGPGAPRAGRARPSQVWSWDITALTGPQKGQWYKLYVVLDIFSRYVPGWLVAQAEDAVVAKDFLADAVARNLVIPHTIHADRGGSMTSKSVSEMMIDLGICRLHSRPRKSNDNPFSEAQFKTLKYILDLPNRLGSLADARAFCDRFSPPTTMSTATPGSVCTPQPQSTTEPRPTSAHDAKPPSTAPTHNTPSGSATGLSRHACPSRRGSTNLSINSHPSKIHCLI